jgi:hypothetical protein
MGILRLTRPPRLLPDRWNPYTVVIDGESVGQIVDGETVEIQVGAGTPQGEGREPAVVRVVRLWRD